MCMEMGFPPVFQVLFKGFRLLIINRCLMDLKSLLLFRAQMDPHRALPFQGGPLGPSMIYRCLQ